MTGTARASERATRRLVARARRTPPPATMTPRSDAARSFRTRRTADRSAAGPRAPVGATRGRVPDLDLDVQDVAGQRQEDGPGTAAAQPARGTGQGGDHLVRVVHLARPRRQAADALHEVALLEGLAPEVGALDLPGEDDERHRVLAGGVDADGGVGGADRARHGDQLRATRRLRQRLGHERGGRLVSGGHDADALSGQVVEERQDRLARNREAVAGASAPAAGGPPRPRPCGARGLAWAPRRRHRQVRRLGRGLPARPPRSPRRRTVATAVRSTPCCLLGALLGLGVHLSHGGRPDPLGVASLIGFVEVLAGGRCVQQVGRPRSCDGPWSAVAESSVRRLLRGLLRGVPGQRWLRPRSCRSHLHHRDDERDDDDGGQDGQEEARALRLSAVMLTA